MGERFHGGSAVPGGYYLNASRWAVEPIARDGDRLPVGPGEWRRVPMPIALALVPILGVTFLMFMPIVGFLVLGMFCWEKARRLFTAGGSPEPKPPPAADAPDGSLKPEA